MRTPVFSMMVAVWLTLMIAAVGLYSLVDLSIQPDSLSAALPGAPSN
jgi:hypothetical protein